MRHLPQHRAQTMERLGRELGETDIVDPAAVLEQSEIPGAIARFDALDLRERGLQRAAVIEGVPVGELEAIPRRQRDQLDVIGEAFAEEREQFFEQERRRDDRRAGVVSEARALIDLGASAQGRAAVDEGHGIAFGA